MSEHQLSPGHDVRSAIIRQKHAEEPDTEHYDELEDEDDDDRS